MLLATERADRLPAIRNVDPIKKFTLDLYSHWIPEMEDFMEDFTADARDEIF